MHTFPVEEAQERFEELLELAKQGDEVYIVSQSGSLFKLVWTDN